MKIIKYLAIVAIFLAVSLGGVVIALNTIELDRYKNVLEQQVVKMTGRGFAIAGNTELLISLQPRIVLRNVQLDNASWGSQPEMLKAGKVVLQVALLPLFTGRIEVLDLSVDDMEILLESNEENNSNWAFADAEPDSDSDATSGRFHFEIELQDVNLKNIRIAFERDGGRKWDELILQELLINRSGARLQAWDVKAKFKDTPISVTGTTSFLHNLMVAKPFQSDLKGRLGDVEFTLNGSVTLNQGFDGLDIKTVFSSPNLATIARLAEIELPAGGPLALTANVSDKEESYQIQLDASLDDVKLMLDALVGRALDGKGVAVNLAVTAPDLQQLGELGGGGLPAVSPVDVKVKITDTNGGYTITALRAKIGDSDLNGAASVLYQKEPVFIKAELTSNRLDLVSFNTPDPSKKTGNKAKLSADSSAVGPHSAQTRVAGTDAAVENPGAERLFSDEPLPLGQLKLLDADIKYEIKELAIATQTLRNAHLGLKLQNGKLVMDPVEAQLHGSQIEGNASLDASQSKAPAALALKLRAKGLKLGEFEQLREHMKGGSTNFNMNLQGAGLSVREIMGGLNGGVLIDIGEAELTSDVINLVGGNLLTSLFSQLTPEEHGAGKGTLKCTVIKFDIQDGVARTDKGIALETKKVAVIGAGEIDFKTEKIDLEFRSQDRAAVGVDPGDFTQVVGLGGTLADPAAVADIEGVAATGATVGAAVLTLGTSYIAQKLIDSRFEDQNPCLTALGKAPPAADKAELEGAKQ
jgi:hypothetical protein